MQRVWLDNGHQVHFVQNITDIDDPLLERASRDGIDWRDLAAREIQLFREDMTALRVLPPRDYIGAVEAMDEVSAAVQALIDAGAAYRVDDPDHPDVYFDIATAPKFGYESRYDLATMLDAVRRTRRRPGTPGQAEPAGPVAVAHPARG